MNKTRRRAIQKHRAKDAKIDVRRRTSGDLNEPKGKQGPAIARSAAGSRTTARRASGAEASE